MYIYIYINRLFRTHLEGKQVPSLHSPFFLVNSDLHALLHVWAMIVKQFTISNWNHWMDFSNSCTFTCAVPGASVTVTLREKVHCEFESLLSLALTQ